MKVFCCGRSLDVEWRDIHVVWGLGKREVVSGEKNCTYRALEVHGLHRSLELEWGV